MIQDRLNPAISVVKYQDYSEWCEWELNWNKKIVVSKACVRGWNKRFGFAAYLFCYTLKDRTDRETYWYTQKCQKTPPLRGALWANKTKTIRIRSNTVPDPPLLMSLPTWPVWCPLLLLPESSSHTNGPFKPDGNRKNISSRLQLL